MASYSFIFYMGLVHSLYFNCITLVFRTTYILIFFCVGAMYSGEYDACDVTLSVYPHQASLKNMPGHGGNRTYDFRFRFDSHRVQAYFSSLPGVDIHRSE
jgi:hypothetical protein